MKKGLKLFELVQVVTKELKEKDRGCPNFCVNGIKEIFSLSFLTCVNTSDDLPGKNGVIKKLIEHLTE